MEVNPRDPYTHGMGEPRITHELEQLQAVLRDLAPVLAAFRDWLVNAGFSRGEAVDLVGELLTEIYRRGNG